MKKSPPPSRSSPLTGGDQGHEFDPLHPQRADQADGAGGIRRHPQERHHRRGLDEGDVLVDAKLTDEKREVLIGTKNGMCIRFPAEQVRLMGRAAGGVRGIRLDKGDQVVGMEITTPGRERDVGDGVRVRLRQAHRVVGVPRPKPRRRRGHHHQDVGPERRRHRREAGHRQRRSHADDRKGHGRARPHERPVRHRAEHPGLPLSSVWRKATSCRSSPRWWRRTRARKAKTPV
jgi:DNA gyrase/topoisomerase IV subunit A